MPKKAAVKAAPNADRIAQGKALADLYIKQARLGPEDAAEVNTVVTDCIVDLLHYAHVHGVDTRGCTEMAHVHLDAELNGEGDL